MGAPRHAHGESFGTTAGLEDAWVELHAATPAGSNVGRPWQRHGLRHRQLITMAVIAAAVISGCFGMNRGHPEPNPVRGYRLEISEGDARFRPLSVGAQGEGCEVLLPDADANRTCLIATNVIATLIGGEADGDLNEQRTPALDALIWKARSDGDVSVCQRGGLANGFLEECERAASSTDYEYEGDEVRVRVPIGGAESLAPSIDRGVATPAIELPWPSTPGASLPPPTVEPSPSMEAHDRFWNPFVDFGPPFGLPFGLETLEDATDLADIVIRGSITDLYIGEQWIGAKDEPGEPLAYVAVEIHDVLKGEPESRTEGLVEVQFGFGFRESDFDAIASAPMPEGDYLWFLIDESKFREKKDQAPRDSEIAPFAYFIPNEVQGVVLEANGSAEVVLADRFESAWGTGRFPMTIRGGSFESVIDQIRTLVASRQ